MHCRWKFNKVIIFWYYVISFIHMSGFQHRFIVLVEIEVIGVHPICLYNPDQPQQLAQSHQVHQQPPSYGQALPTSAPRSIAPTTAPPSYGSRSGAAPPSYGTPYGGGGASSHTASRAIIREEAGDMPITPIAAINPYTNRSSSPRVNIFLANLSQNWSLCFVSYSHSLTPSNNSMHMWLLIQYNSIILTGGQSKLASQKKATFALGQTLKVSFN